MHTISSYSCRKVEKGHLLLLAMYSIAVVRRTNLKEKLGQTTRLVLSSPKSLLDFRNASRISDMGADNVQFEVGRFFKVAMAVY